MVFDIGAGLSEMGKSVAQTAQAYTLESQRAELEKEKVRLADELLGAREEKGRQFTTSERLSTQQFTGAENEKTRTNQLDIANVGLKGQLAHAGAMVQSAIIGRDSHLTGIDKQIQAQTFENDKARVAQSSEKALDRSNHLEGIDKQLRAMEPERNATVEAKNVETKVKTQLLDARTEYVAALEKNDLEGTTKAIQKMAGIEFSPKDQYTEANLYQQQARLYEQAMTAAQSKLAQLQANPTASMTDAGKAAIDALGKQVIYFQGQFASSIASAQLSMKRIPQFGQSTKGEPSSSPIIQYDSKGNRIQQTPAPGGLINTPANP